MEHSEFLILLGGLFLLSLAVSPIAEKFKIPRASLFILCGVLIAQFGGSTINGHASEWFSVISNFTLLIIGYLLGTKLTISYLRHYAAKISISATIVTLGTFIVVACGLYLLNLGLVPSIILASIAVATDPAATMDVVAQHRKQNQFTNLIQGIVALDDALGLILFSLVMAFAGFYLGLGSQDSPFIQMLWELSGALITGGVMGLLLVYLLNKKAANHSVLVESLGLIIFCGGVSLYCHFSYLLAAMTMGFVVVNRADSSQEHFHELENIEQPFLVLFFVLAGASLEVQLIQQVFIFLLAYILLRIAGRYLSGLFIPSSVVTTKQKHWIGLALLPQAGVAMGMALLATETIGEQKDMILAVTISATVIFEFIGPVITNQAIKKNLT